MRHRKLRSRLSMKTARRDATMRNMVKSLLKHQQIRTTLARAKVVRRHAEHLITMARTDTIAARRRAYSFLTDRDLVGKLFKEIVPLFKARTSGYTRIITLGFRRGDGATMAILELTDKKMVEKLARKKKEKMRAETPKSEKAEDVRKIKEESKKEHKKEEPKIKTIPKSKPTLEEEKRHEKARTEDRKIADKKGFMKNLRGFFRRKTDM